VSLVLFVLSHLLLFHLHLPSRYVKYSLPLVLAIAAGLALAMVAVLAAARFRPPRRRLLSTGLALALGGMVSIYPGRYDAELLADPRPALTELLRSLPKDVLIAGPSSDTDLIPYFASRRVVASRMAGVFPFWLGF